MPRQWTLLAKVDAGNVFFNRGAWEMLHAQVVAEQVPVVPVVIAPDMGAVVC